MIEHCVERFLEQLARDSVQETKKRSLRAGGGVGRAKVGGPVNCRVGGRVGLGVGGFIGAAQNKSMASVHTNVRVEGMPIGRLWQED